MGKNSKWTEEEDAILKKYYGILAYKDQLEFLPSHRTVNSIQNRVQQLGLFVTPQCTINALTKVDDKFFSNLSSTNCYWGGFISADGWIEEGTLKLKVPIQDSNHLLIFKDQIQHKEHAYKESVNDDGKFSAYVEMSIDSNQICDDLNQHFGITRKKSKVSFLPSLPNDLLDAWIIGHIDGNGTVEYSRRKEKQNYLNLIVVGTEDVCLGIRNRFSEILGEKIENTVGKYRDLYRIQLCGGKAVDLYNHFRMVEVPKMNRKWKYTIKNWGYEIEVTNSEKYCGKLLYFNKGKRCSFHHHSLKHETFFLHSGCIILRYSWGDCLENSDVMELKPGSVMEIPVGLNHQMIAKENSYLYEFSTQHFDEDSIRLVRGD